MKKLKELFGAKKGAAPALPARERIRKAAKDFWYGKPHGERRLGELYMDKTGLYRHREWRGVKDTFYYFNNIWLYNYAHMVTDILQSDEPLAFFKGVWRYRWVGQTYLTVMHWFDRGMEGLRGEALKAIGALALVVPDDAYSRLDIICGAIKESLNSFRWARGGDET